jgi:hypothetical protein
MLQHTDITVEKLHYPHRQTTQSVFHTRMNISLVVYLLFVSFNEYKKLKLF